MTPQDGITLLRQRLKARAPSNQLGDHLLRELNAVQLELELGPLYPFFLESRSTGIVPSTTFNGFTLPDDYIVEHEERPIVWTSADGLTEIALEKKLFEELEQKFGAEGDRPHYYAIVGGTDVYTFPFVSTGTYSIRYYAHMAQISEDNINTTNKWWRFAPFLLIAKAGLNYAANTLGDAELSQVFSGQVTEAYNQLLALNTQQSMAKFDASAQFLQV